MYGSVASLLTMENVPMNQLNCRKLQSSLQFVLFYVVAFVIVCAVAVKTGKNFRTKNLSSISCLFIFYSLFNIAVNNSEYIASNDRIINE
jgi:hypothetical protein